MREYILVDIDTQSDFLLAEGSRCIRNHRRVIEKIRRMMAWARFNNIKVISTCRILPDKSDAGGKISYTLLNHRFSFPATDCTDLPRDLLHRYQQIIVQKRCINPFDERLIHRILSELQAEKFILIGANIENAISVTAQGFLQRGSRIIIVTDAFGSYNVKKRKLEFRKMKEKGAKFIETRNLAGNSSLRKRSMVTV